MGNLDTKQAPNECVPFITAEKERAKGQKNEVIGVARLREFKLGVLNSSFTVADKAKARCKKNSCNRCGKDSKSELVVT